MLSFPGSLRSMAVLSGSLLSGEAASFLLLPPQSPRSSLPLYTFARPTKTAMLRGRFSRAHGKLAETTAWRTWYKHTDKKGNLIKKPEDTRM